MDEEVIERKAFGTARHGSHIAESVREESRSPRAAAGPTMAQRTLPLEFEKQAHSVACDPTLSSGDRVHDATAEHEAVSTVPTGTLVGNVYRVIGQLGSGGMGVVLLAHDATLDRLVAVKFVHNDLRDDCFRERFMAEARAMARVNHPNVLQIYSYGEHGGSPYFVMELVDGSTLEEWLVRSRGTPGFDDVAMQILEGVCDGVVAIHNADTVHRDLKPSNILLDAALRPRIADLGLAVLCRQDRPSQQELVGTPAYMAPEIAFSAAVEPALQARADVYSLACVAYELFTGRPPFVSDNNVDLLLQHATMSVPSPLTFRADLPEELGAALLRALAKDPAERTASVDAFRREVLAARCQERGPVHILIAEDHEDFRGALQTILATEFPSAEIECVGDGPAALDAFDRRHPSVAILDLRMPGIDGIELTRLFRERDQAATIPIIVLTASGGADEWRRASAYGADRFLVKPVVLDDVVTLVRRLLKERSKRPAARSVPDAVG